MRSHSARRISPPAGGQLPAQQPQQSGLAAAIRPDQSHPHAGGDHEIEILEQVRSFDLVSHIFQFNQPLGLAIGGREIDLRGGGARPRIQVGQLSHQLIGFADARLGLPGPCLGAAAQPLNLVVDQVLQRFLPLRLGVQKFFLLLQERAVVSPHPQDAIGIDAAQFRHVGGDILQKIAVVTHDHAGECGLRQQIFEPLDSRQVEMVGRFIQQQDVRRLHQRLDDRQALLPAAGKRRGFGVEVFKTGAAQGFSESASRARWRAPLPRSMAFSTTDRTVAPDSNFESCST